jgi:glyoxylase-like metal-dependent hydrolase (beta-lactamase superfamily II)
MAIPLTSSAPRSPKIENPFAPRKYGELQRVTERVYILRNITNSSFVIGDRSVAVIDTQVNFPSAAELLRLVRTVTDKPIEYVINTHYHWDHTNGNALFKKEGAAIVSSALTKDFMVSRAPRQKEFLAGRGFELGDDPFLPERTFSGEMEIDLGNMPLRLFFAGTAESDDATAVHVVKEKVVMSGDTVMTGSFPIFGQPVWDEGLQGPEWLKTIDNLLALKPAHIVPGHGPLAYDAEIALLTRIQRYFLDEVGSRVSKGMTLDAILKDLEPKLPGWITSLPVVWGTPRYAILRVWRGLTKKASDDQPGWQQFKPSAIPQLSDMAHEAQEGGDTALKLSILKKAAFESPDEAGVFSEYAEALIEASRCQASVLEKGDFFQEARAAWERAMAINPSHVPTLLGKGRYLTMMAYRGGDDPRRGMELLERIAGGSARQMAEAEFYIGMGHRRLGDEAKAMKQFEKALSHDPSFMPARKAQ